MNTSESQGIKFIPSIEKIKPVPITIVVGKNGVGKTAFLQALSSLYVHRKFIESEYYMAVDLVKNLTKAQLDDLNKYLSDCFNLTIEYDDSSKLLHIHLNSPKYEVSGIHGTDLGIGYKHLLPIFIQLYAACQVKHQLVSNAIICLNQPEIHLHPVLQANMADAIVACVKNRKEKDIHIVVETFSSALIGRLGELIYEREIRCKDITVLYLDRKDNKTSIRRVTYDRTGALRENWPFGFFNW